MDIKKFNAINAFGQPVLYPFIAILWMCVLGLVFAFMTINVMRKRQIA
ncbi:hypothetical protein [Alkalihalobacillus sp. CinArs1]|nr:hypothetical protein [Alkalihalobacillus sp. CinArs1]